MIHSSHTRRSSDLIITIWALAAYNARYANGCGYNFSRISVYFRPPRLVPRRFFLRLRAGFHPGAAMRLLAFLAVVFCAVSARAETVGIAFIDPLSGPAAAVTQNGLNHFRFMAERLSDARLKLDRKSTRLNSSH